MKKHMEVEILIMHRNLNEDDESVTSINEEDGIDTMNEVDDIIEMFPEGANGESLRSTPEEANDEYLRSAESSPKRQNSKTGIYILVMSFDQNTYKSGKKYS